ncbi:hypothetical protein ACVW0P_000213 [Mucilaginibacter sp. UYNi724]
MDNKHSDVISLSYIILRVKLLFAYLIKKWLFILVCGSIGAASGYFFAKVKRNTYSAECTFVLQDGDKGGLGQYAGLASLAGISLDGGGDGLFQGDNIFELYKSRTMLEKTLLKKVLFNGKPQLLIDRYIEENKFRKTWADQKLGNINFNTRVDRFSRVQDSLMTDIVKRINKTALTVIKPDKKLAIIHVTVKSKDELFAQAFANEIVKDVNDFYVQTKTKKSTINVQLLQKQADSVKRVVNQSIGGVASSLDAAPNANPQMLTLRVPSQRKQVDVQASVAVYGEIVKNLEISKLGLLKETPLIQVIDAPILPLESNKIPKKIAFIAGFMLFSFLAAAWFALKFFTQKSQQS